MGTKAMLLAVALISLLLGFILGRIWEIRQRIILAEPVPRPVEISPANKASKQAPIDDSKLAALDREMQDLIKAVAISGQRGRQNWADR
jgi:hypothetical protein